jgi:DNA invertase Pin-like site-specific DNA recombinase
MKIAVYERVSKGDGSQHTENQAYQLREFCVRNSWQIVAEYVDTVSGKSSAARSQFQQMMQDASKRKFDAVVVWALDRFTREGVMMTFDHIKRLLSHNVQFISYTEEHFRTNGPMGELMIALSAWIAQQERLRISTRTKAGLERAVRAGKTLGRPRQVVDIYGINQLRSSGLSLGAIAKKLDIPKTTVARIAKLPYGLEPTGPVTHT